MTAASRASRERRGAVRSSTAARASGSLPGCSAYCAKSLRAHVVVGRLAPHPGDRWRSIAAPRRRSNDVRRRCRPARAGRTAPAAPVASSSSVHGAQREADGVDRALGGQGVDDAGREVGVGRRVVGLRRVAVAEQVDADHRPPGVLEQRAPNPVACHVALERAPQPWTSRTDGLIAARSRPLGRRSLRSLTRTVARGRATASDGGRPP